MNAGKRGITANEEIEQRMVDCERSQIKDLTREINKLRIESALKLHELETRLAQVKANLQIDEERLKQTQNGHPTPNEPFKKAQLPTLGEPFIMQPCKGNNLH